MGYFKEGRETIKVNLPSNEDYWVEVYTDIQWGQSKHALHVDSAGNVDMMLSADKLLSMLIIDWNLDDDKSEKQPITPENIDRLDPADALFIINKAGGDKVKIERAKKN